MKNKTRGDKQNDFERLVCSKLPKTSNLGKQVDLRSLAKVPQNEESVDTIMSRRSKVIQSNLLNTRVTENTMMMPLDVVEYLLRIAWKEGKGELKCPKCDWPISPRWCYCPFCGKTLKPMK